MKKMLTVFLMTCTLMCGMIIASRAAVVGDFSDLSKEAWYYSSVKTAVNKEYLSGTAYSTFSPNENTSRGMVVSVLYRMAGSPEVNLSEEIPFADVSTLKPTWYTAAVYWARDNGIVSGLGDNRFGANVQIDRQQLAVILSRILEMDCEHPDWTVDMTAFGDNDKIASWARNAMKAMVYQKYLYGTTVGNRT